MTKLSLCIAFCTGSLLLGQQAQAGSISDLLHGEFCREAFIDWINDPAEIKAFATGPGYSCAWIGGSDESSPQSQQEANERVFSYCKSELKAECSIIATARTIGYGELPRGIIDLRSFTGRDFDLLLTASFGAAATVPRSDSGNPFQDRRNDERAIQNFNKEAQRKYGSFPDYEVVFAAYDAPITAELYNFQEQTFIVCLPGTWAFRQGEFNLGNRELTFEVPHNGSLSTLNCAPRTPPSYSFPQVEYFRYSDATILYMPSESFAEEVQIASNEGRLSADVYCNLPFRASGGIGGARRLGCAVSRIDFKIDGAIHFSQVGVSYLPGTVMTDGKEEFLPESSSQTIIVRSPSVSPAEGSDPTLQDEPAANGVSPLLGRFETRLPSELSCEENALVVTSMEVVFGESICRLANAIPDEASEFSSLATCTGNGQSWETSLTLSALGGGEISVAGPDTRGQYRKCEIAQGNVDAPQMEPNVAHSQQPSTNGSQSQVPGDVKERIRMTQENLNRVGCEVGQADGVPGQMTRRGYAAYLQQKGLPEQDYPLGSSQLLVHILEARGTVCESPPPIALTEQNLSGQWSYVSTCGPNSRLPNQRITGILDVRYASGEFTGSLSNSQGLRGRVNGTLRGRQIDMVVNWGLLLGRTSMTGTIADDQLVISGRDSLGCRGTARKQ